MSRQKQNLLKPTSSSTNSCSIDPVSGKSLERMVCSSNSPPPWSNTPACEPHGKSALKTAPVLRQLTCLRPTWRDKSATTSQQGFQALWQFPTSWGY
ncbi:hypothetical protein KR51_00021000 [Rubidibacter lacunae KORDI 51-2]|uniref:Uncharacterized protein n=1 Tax=Rubidibacter lacunae KORDI 51-2 TaxID=582515 RepID=U5DL49_9CHRO|nr:hypothetical protein KR51_00021000 [Rubidibacter lacunae KORDI 51-2]